MPDGGLELRSPRQVAALGSVEAWLSTLPGSSRRLTFVELAHYKARHPVVGWRIVVHFENAIKAVTLDVLADQWFPNSPVRIAIPDSAESRNWPHIESDGVICLLPSAASIDVDAPVEVTKHQLGDASALIEDSLAGTNRGDFLSEIQSYWTRDLAITGPRLLALLRMSEPSRIVKVYRAKSYDVVGDDSDGVLRWLLHLGIKAEAKTFDDGLLFWLDRPPFPEEYPGTGLELRAMLAARCPDGVALLEAQVARDPAELVILFGAITDRGPSILGGTIMRGIQPQRPRGGRSGSTAGFTGRQMPPSVAVPRYLGSAKVARRPAIRIDAAWIHGRDLDAGAQALQKMKVAVLGCGSVGGPVAVRLAQAGVGSLYLIDGDVMSSANVGRHTLGVPKISLHKATALASEIKTRFPHLQLVEGIASDWMTAHAEHPDLLESCDLIVAAMADWTADSLLNEWHVVQGRQKPILYVWTEAHACAGHAVLIKNEGGCLRCGFSSTGTPSLRVCEWPNETQAREPACGALFQPYGPVEMAHVEALACEMATDALLSPPSASAHHIWAARQPLLASTGGSWSAQWTSLHPDRSEGAFMDSRAWFRGPCRSCSQTPS